MAGALQAPLQPLQDNLELQTYETFEKDVQKYAQYEEAVLQALLDRVPEAEASTRETVLMVRDCSWPLHRCKGVNPALSVKNVGLLLGIS
jgi:hypothetical protein